MSVPKKIETTPTQARAYGFALGLAAAVSTLEEASDPIAKLPGFQHALALVARAAADERAESTKRTFVAATKAGVDLTRYKMLSDGLTITFEDLDLEEQARTVA